MMLFVIFLSHLNYNSISHLSLLRESLSRCVLPQCAVRSVAFNKVFQEHNVFRNESNLKCPELQTDWVSSLSNACEAKQRTNIPTFLTLHQDSLQTSHICLQIMRIFCNTNAAHDINYIYLHNYIYFSCLI